jgi:hypothetical protein
MLSDLLEDFAMNREVTDLLPCPFCGDRSPFTYITFSCAVLRCSCGAEINGGAVTVMYQRGDVPDGLKSHIYEPNCLVIIRDGKEIKYPDHGYVGVNVMAAFEYAGLTAKWNNRINR